LGTCAERVPEKINIRESRIRFFMVLKFKFDQFGYKYSH